MKDIPLFTSDCGLATLILREIGWSGSAYVLVRSVWNGRVVFENSLEGPEMLELSESLLHYQDAE